MSENGLQDDAQKLLIDAIERIERLTDEKKSIQDDINDIFKEAEGKGLDKAMMKKVLAARKKSKTELQEERSILDVYLHAVGLLPDEEEKTA